MHGTTETETAARRRNKSHRIPNRPPFECIALLLQGGGALGSYQAGVYEALAEAARLLGGDHRKSHARLDQRARGLVAEGRFRAQAFQSDQRKLGHVCRRRWLLRAA